MSFSFSKGQMTASFMSQRTSKNIKKKKKSNTQELIAQEVMLLGTLREYQQSQSLTEKQPTPQLQPNALGQTK